MTAARADAPSANLASGVSARSVQPKNKARAGRKARPKKAANVPVSAAKAPPFVVFGPPLPPERALAIAQARHLLAAVGRGQVRLLVPARDGEQLSRLAAAGVYRWPAPPTAPKMAAAPAAPPARKRAAVPPAIFAAPLRRVGPLLMSRHASPALRTSTEEPANLPMAANVVGSDLTDLPPPSPDLMHLLTTLAAHSSPRKPLQLLSLLRPPYRTGSYVHTGPRNPHALGLAADIGAYGGFAIRQENPEACVRAALALLRDLPPGHYRLGMPKAPETAGVATGAALPPSLDLLELRNALAASEPFSSPSLPTRWNLPPASGFASPSEASGAASIPRPGNPSKPAKPWPFFPAPFVETIVQTYIEEGRSGRRIGTQTRPGKVAGAISQPPPIILRYRNESYAPEADLADVRLKKALERARQRGADVTALFPDGADHIHIDVRAK